MRLRRLHLVAVTACLAMLALPASAQAGFGLTKLRLDSRTGTETYLFAAGNVIAPEGSTDAGKFHTLTVLDSAGTVQDQTACSSVSGAVPETYSVQDDDPAAAGTAWTYRLDQYTTSACSGTPAKTSSLRFSVAVARVWSDPALTTSPAYLPPGATAYVRVGGAAKLDAAGTLTNGTDWDVTWYDPAGTAVCVNNGGGDRPDSLAGALPGVTGHYLQMRPSATDPGDDFNWEAKYDVRPCPSPTAVGTWKLRLELDATHVATMDAFTISTVSLPTISGSPVTPGNTRTPAWSFSGGGGTGYQCRLLRGATTISDWASCTSAKSYDLTGQPDGAYTFGVRTIEGSVRGPEATSTYTLDTTAPAAPAFSATPGAQGNDPTVAWSFSSAGATFECRLERGLTLVTDWAPCTSPAGYDLTASGDGSYTLSVRSRDPVGNRSAPTLSTYVLDMTAPPAPVLGGPASPGNDAAPTWTVSAEPGASVQCRLTRGAAVVAAWAPCSSPRTYDLSGEVDGTYTLAVQATDAVGNAGTVATATYVLDRAIPVGPIITAHPISPDADPTIQWSFTAEAGAATYCRLSQGLTVVSDWAICTGTADYDLAARSDGTYTFAVHAVDAAGNVSGDTLWTYVLDRQAPAAPAVTGPPSPGNDAAPPWSVSAEAGAALECRLERGGTLVADWGACASPHSPDLSSADGTYVLRVRATDAAGNTSGEGSASYVLDRAAPGPVGFDSTPPASGTDSTPAWTFSTAESGVSIQCRITRDATTVVEDWATCTSPRSVDLSADGDGAFTLDIRARDDAGNTGPIASSSYTLDTAAAPAPTIDSAPASPDKVTTPQWTFTGEPGASLECHLARGSTAISPWSPCSGTKGYDLSAQADGIYAFAVRQTDGAGNTGAAAVSTYVLDTTAPGAPAVDAPAAPARDGHPSFTFTADPGAATTCRLERDGALVSDWTGCGSPRVPDLTALADGTYKLLVKATDSVGNTGQAGSATYTLDRTAPAAPQVVGPTSPGDDAQPTWSLTAEGGAGLECRLEQGATLVSDWAVCPDPARFDLRDEADGGYLLSVRATDAAGNTSAIATSAYTLDTAAPGAPAIDAAPPATGTSTAPQWRFSTTEPSSSLECRTERGATVVEDWATCTSPHPADLSGETDGDFTLLARVRDQAGNAGVAASATYKLDRAAPAAPAVIAPGSPARDAHPSFTFTAENGTATSCRLERAGALVSDWASCSSPRIPDLTARPDGTYTLLVKATDGAGNTSPAGTATYTIDRVAPAAPDVSGGPQGTSRDEHPEWSISGEAGAGLECRLERDGTLVADWAGCADPKGYDLSSRADGAYTFSVRATDAAGNTSAPAGATYTLDRTGPAAPRIDQNPPEAGRVTDPQWRFSTDEAGATLECQTERGATVIEDWAACTSPHAADLAGASDGDYTLLARARDAAGNAGPAVAAGYTLDRVAPDAPAITAAPTSPGAEAVPSWGWSGETGTRYDCRLERDGAVVEDWASCSAPTAFDLRGRVDGAYALAVRATDPAGNTGATRRSAYTLDRSAPAAPSITGGPPALSRDANPTWAFTSEEATTTECRLIRDTTVVSDWSSCALSRRYEVGGLGDGTYGFAVRSRDAAGNAGPAATAAYVLDLTPSGAPQLGGPRSPGNDRSPAWTFSGEAADGFECRLERGPTLIADWSACTSPRRFELTGEPDAGYTFVVRAVDAAGNAGTPSVSTYDLDTTAPAAPKLAGARVRGRDLHPSWAFSGEGGRYECRLPAADWSACASPLVLDLAGRSDGDFPFAVREQDAAGNIGAETTSAYRLDTTGPVVTVRAAGEAGSGRASFTFTAADDEASFECRLRQGTSVVSEWAPCTSPRAYTLSDDAPDATYTFSVRGVDTLGNVGAVRSESYTAPSEAAAAPAVGAPHATPPSSAPAPATEPHPAAAGATAPNGDRDAAPADEKDTKPAAAAPRTAPAPRAQRATPSARKTPAERHAPATRKRRHARTNPGKAAVKAVAAVAKQVGEAARVVAKNADKSVFPMSLLFVVIGFLGLQNRIDRGDPKLALAPLAADQEMEFIPPPSLRPAP